MKKKDLSRDLAVMAADLAADGKALDITLLDLHEVSSVADWFVIASGRSHIQVEAVCDRILEGVEERLGATPISIEGLENAHWALLDYGSVVIHVFQESVRKLYDLERLWSLAPRFKHEDAATGAPAKRAARTETAAPPRKRRASAGAATRDGDESAEHPRRHALV